MYNVSDFSDALPLIEDAIEECDFMAIDTELTGLLLFKLILACI